MHHLSRNRSRCLLQQIKEYLIQKKKVGVLRPSVPPAFLAHLEGCLNCLAALCHLLTLFRVRSPCSGLRTLTVTLICFFGRDSLTLIPVSATEWATLAKTPLPSPIVVDERTSGFLQHLPKDMLVRPEDLTKCYQIQRSLLARVSLVKFQGRPFVLKEPSVSGLLWFALLLRSLQTCSDCPICPWSLQGMLPNFAGFAIHHLKTST
jgi:hypothetical protein